MNPKILPIVIAIIMSFGNKSALVEQARLQQYQQENYIDTRYITIATIRPKTKIPKNSRLVRYYKFADDKDNRLIFGMIYADSKYVNDNCCTHYIKDTYNKECRAYQRNKTDCLLNEIYSMKVYTADNKKFYVKRSGMLK